MPGRGNLGELLTMWRHRLPPAAVGLPTISTRVTGLRREEVAMLASMSVDYISRLEQGRARHPSAAVTATLARVLQLSLTERDQLFVAAGLPVPQPTVAPSHLPPSVQRLLARLPDVAIGVYTVHWTLITANDAWRALFGELEPGFNLISAYFDGTSPPTAMSADYVERFEQALVTDLRNACLRYPDDPDIAGLVDTLRVHDRFVRLWAEGTAVEQRSEPKTFIHPQVGLITLDCDVYTTIGSDLRIITYTAAPATADAVTFDLLRTMGVTSAPERDQPGRASSG